MSRKTRAQIRNPKPNGLICAVSGRRSALANLPEGGRDLLCLEEHVAAGHGELSGQADVTTHPQEACLQVGLLVHVAYRTGYHNVLLLPVLSCAAQPGSPEAA